MFAGMFERVQRATRFNSASMWDWRKDVVGGSPTWLKKGRRKHISKHYHTMTHSSSNSFHLLVIPQPSFLFLSAFSGSFCKCPDWALSPSNLLCLLPDLISKSSTLNSIQLLTVSMVISSAWCIGNGSRSRGHVLVQPTWWCFPACPRLSYRLYV